MKQEPDIDAPVVALNPTDARHAGRRRTLLRWFIAAVALLLVAGIVGLLSVDYLGRIAIETGGTRSLGVPTTLDELSIGFFSGGSSLAGFQVANPEGFQSTYFLRLDDGSLDMSLGNVLNETVEIEQLSLSGIRLNLVRETREANYRTIIDAIQRFEEKGEDEAGTDAEVPKRFLIHSVVIRDVNVHIDLLPMGGKAAQLDVPIDLLELHEVGAESNRGENISQVIATVVRALLEAVLLKSEGLLPADLREELRHTLSEMKPIESLREIRSSLQERRQERLQRAEPRRQPLTPLRRRRQENR